MSGERVRGKPEDRPKFEVLLMPPETGAKGEGTGERGREERKKAKERKKEREQEKGERESETGRGSRGERVQTHT